MFPFCRTTIAGLALCILLAPAALHAQDQNSTDTTAAGMLVDTVPAEAYAPASTIASDAASPEDNTLEGRMRAASSHALYDTVQAGDEDQADIDYATRWDRQLPANATSEMRKDKELNYDTRDHKPSAFLRGLQIVLAMIFLPALYILLGATLVMVILYILMNNDIQLFRRKQTKVPTVTELETPDTTEDLATGNFDILLQQAMAAGNWTAATRYLYLYTLQQMHQKGLLLLNQHKTNRDYLRDVHNTRWYKPFSLLTLDYEYVCYGNFELSGADFEKIHAQFNAFKQDLQQS